MSQSKDAGRKARQRAGYTSIYVEVHLDTLTAALVAAGLVTDAQIEDLGAVRVAASRVIGDWCKGGARVLRDLTAKEPPQKQTYKPKPPPKPKHGPVRSTVGWTASDTVRWEEGWRGDVISPTGGWEDIRGPRWCNPHPWTHRQVAKRPKKKSPQRLPRSDGCAILRWSPPGKPWK